MNLTQMRYFYEVCKWQSVSKAAALLHISQPTISIALKELEKESHLNLFRRAGRTLVLTEEGQIVLGKITPLLTSLQQVDEEIKSLAQARNHIRLAVPLQIGVRLLPAIFTEFKKLYPEIDLEIVETGGIDSLRMIEAEELDLAITNYDDNFSPNLLYHKIFTNEVSFCVGSQHPLRHLTSITVQEVAQEPLVLLNGSFFINRIVSETFQKAGLSPRVLLYSSQLHTVKNLVKSNAVATFLMKEAILPEDGITAIPISPAYTVNSGIVTKRGRQLYGDEQKLISFLRQKYGKIKE